VRPQPTQLSVDKDTDNDRIPDWQETLIGTNPTIANSESDVPIELRQVITDSVKTGMITTDDKLALKIYQRLAQDPKGQDFAQAIQAATAKEILDLANSLDKGMTSYGLDDLNISDGTLENNTIYIKQTKSLLKDASIPQDLQEKIYTYLMQGGEKNFGITTYQTKIGSIVGKLLETPVSVANANYYL
jgi:cytochrome c-type biogenesis protein CcmH/NrfF